MTLEYDEYKEGGFLNNRYQIVEDISEGSYGYVTLAKDTKEKKLVAVKYIFKLEESEEEKNKNEINDSKEAPSGTTLVQNNESEKNVIRKGTLISSEVKSRLSKNLCYEAMYEVELQLKVGKHKNIVSLIDYFDSYLILEYCSGGDLYEAIKDDIVPRKSQSIASIFRQIMDAVEYVHSKNIFHRDVKPENILISGIDWTIKLTDWGLATTSVTSLDRNVGSERYMAPELFETNLDINERKEPYVCAKVDLWAMGVVFLNVVFQKNPFSVANQSDKSFCYFAANREALFDAFSTMSYDFFQVLRYCLTIDPTNRDLAKMRMELDNLNEFTLDDEYYNNLGSNNITAISEAENITKKEQIISSVPVPCSLPTPIPSIMVSAENKTESTLPTFVQNETESTAHDMNERAKSVPKFKFQKRSHPKSDATSTNTTQRRKSFNDSKPKKTTAIKIQNRKRSRLIKNSRKPFGLPTPNTHMDNYFDEYNKSRDNFNTSDFFTPPSVHNRYMEGIFNKQHKNQHYKNNNNNNYNGNKLWQKNLNNYTNNYSKSRRPSTTGSYYGESLTIPKFKTRSRSNSNSRFGSSPNRHIPNLHKSHDSVSMDYLIQQDHQPYMSDQPTRQTFHEQYANENHNLESGENDLDDVLFTLEENEYDFVQDMSSLSLKNHPARGISSHSNGQVPDLLTANFEKHSTEQNGFMVQNQMNNELQGPTARRRTSSIYKQKPGIYVPPHQRRLSESTNEATLLLSNNTVNFSSSYNPSRPSQPHPGDFSHLSSSPFSSYHPAKSTTAVQNNDIFAISNEKALVFEDDEEPPERRNSIFDTYALNELRTKKLIDGRKSSGNFKEQAVSSLDEYKKNWILLQQQQD